MKVKLQESVDECNSIVMNRMCTRADVHHRLPTLSTQCVWVIGKFSTVDILILVA